MVSSQTIALFAGAWSLVNNTRTDNGVESVDSTYGTAPKGVLYYLPNGFMSACLTSTDPDNRPEGLTLPYQANQSDAEWAEIGRHSLAYAGPFDLNVSSYEEATGSMTGQITHGPLYTSTLPSYQGTYLPRQFEFANNYTQLTLTSDIGNGLVDHLVWKRFARDIEFGTPLYN